MTQKIHNTEQAKAVLKEIERLFYADFKIKSNDSEIVQKVKDLLMDNKMYWKMIKTLQNLLYQQFKREIELMEQLELCNCNPELYQKEPTDTPVAPKTYDNSYQSPVISMETILSHCKTDKQRIVARYYYNQKLDTYHSCKKTAEKVYPNKNPNQARKQVWEIIKRLETRTK